MGVNSLCFDTLRTEEGQIPENIFSSSSDLKVVKGLFSSIPSFRRMGQIKKTKCLAAKNAFGLENNMPVKCLHV